MTPELQKTLSKMPDERLIDVVKNGSVYGYDEETTKLARQILAERGFTLDDLVIAGRGKGMSLESTSAALKAFNRAAIRSIVLWIVCLATILLAVVGWRFSHGLGIWLNVLSITCFLAVVVMEIQVALRIVQFYRLLGKSEDVSGLVAVAIGSLPLWILVYPFVRKKMREDQRAVFGTDY
jgi:hypothetical protein